MNRHIQWNPGIPGGIPDVEVVANVLDFGAKADGVSDDAPAIQRAIDAVDNGAVLIPRGDYVLKKGLRIGKGVVLRGEGADKARLLFDISDGVAIDIIKMKLLGRTIGCVWLFREECPNVNNVRTDFGVRQGS